VKLRASSGGGGGTIELAAPGTYKASLTGIYDIGTQEGGAFGPKRQLLFVWQLFKGGKPVSDSSGNHQTISKFYTASFNEKSNLRADTERLVGLKFRDGDEFDVMGLLGRGCRLQISAYTKQNGEEGVKVTSIMALEEDEPEPNPTAEACGFEITATGCAIPSAVPQWIRKKIEESHEWSGTTPPSPAQNKLNRDREFNEFADGMTSRVANGK
jgi:hypothetical protein